METPYHRWIQQKVEHALTVRRIVVLAGARQVGKTTFSKQLFKNKIQYKTLDDLVHFKSAKDDPVGFLKHDKGTLIIDEIQKVPELLPVLKQIVDENDTPGQFLITGSADIHALPQVNESLAGRIKKITLETLSQGEINGTPPTFLDRAFKQDFLSHIQDCSKKNLISIAFKGGYPEPLKFINSDRTDWFTDYIETMIMKDLKDIANIKNQDALKKLIDVLCSWSTKYIDISGICSQLSISKPTYDSYFNFLKALYLFKEFSPWVYSDYDRIAKRNKNIVCDSGLMAHLLKWNENEVYDDPDRSGKLIETFVGHELSAIIGATNSYKMMQYRDRTNHEIDFIIENDQEELLGIEVKSSSVIEKEDFKHLFWFKKNLVPTKKFTGIVLYSGTELASFGEGFYAVPTAHLWND